MMDESKLVWEVVKEEEITVPGGGGPGKTKLSEFENDVGFITKEEIVDNLESDDPTKPLSARQGKVLFQSVSNGKNLIAAAITDKGVPATGSDTFTTLANKIRQIETDKTGDATAEAEDILIGKTAYARGNKLTGTLALTGTATPGDVLEGSTFYSNDPKTMLTGTIPIRTGHVTGQSVSRSGTTIRIRPQEGYYSGASTNSVQISDPNFVAENIVAGKSIFGLVGTAKLGVGAASGSAPVSTSTLPFVLRSGATVNLRYIEVSQSFGFTPYIIFIRYSSYTYTFYNRYASTAYRISADAQTSRVSIDEAKMYVIQESSPAYVRSNGFLLPVYRSGVTYDWYAIGLV